MKKYVDIIDPVHGFIRVRSSELRVVDHPAFQRLRRIKQLSGAHLTYPGAQHTRFEHSLGVMNNAGMAGEALLERGALNSDAVGELRMAALLHDVGHGPFSHLYEEAVGVSHEKMGRRIIAETQVGDVLESEGYGRRRIADIAFGTSRSRFMNEIVSGPLSADVMDYLPRDGYYTRAEHARIDHMRIIKSMDARRGRLAIERSALHSFESMMHSRYQMFRAVYFHKTVRAVEVMLAEAVRLASGELGLEPDSPQAHLELYDEALMARLCSLKGDMRRAGRLARDCSERRLLKCVYEETTNEAVPPARLEKMRAEIAAGAGLGPQDVFVDSSRTTSTPHWPARGAGDTIMLAGGAGPEEVPISAIRTVAALSGELDILRVYAPARLRKKVEIAAGKALGS